MRKTPLALTALVLAGAALALGACSDNAKLPLSAGIGAMPVLPAPKPSTIPTVNVASASRWAAGEGPVAAQGLAVNAFATGLDHPRWMHVLPNGDVLVAETNKQPRASGGLIGFAEKQVMKIAGAGGPSADRISLLRDADGDGVAEMRSVLIGGLTSPFGMALVGGSLYVANTDALMRFPYAVGQMQVTEAGERLAPLPAAGANRHWTKGLVAGDDGTLYVAVGSDSDHAENGLEAEDGRAMIHAYDPASGRLRPFATGLRNPVGMAFEPESGVLWTAVNERDQLGGDLVPDYMTSVKDDGFYGWPWSYFGDNVDPRVTPKRPDMVAKAIAPDYALGAHTASLGLSFATGAQLGSRFAQGAFVGQHGSWNRKPRSGYRVIFVPFAGGKPAGDPVEVLTGFVQDDRAKGRPVGVEIAGDGALLVADDVGNTIWRVTAAQ